MTSATYRPSDLYRPEWHLKRDEIKWRDGLQCTNCGSREKLHVHHEYYEVDKFAWEYPNNSLQTLCEYCHIALHKRNNLRSVVELKREENGKN